MERLLLATSFGTSSFVSKVAFRGIKGNKKGVKYKDVNHKKGKPKPIYKHFTKEMVCTVTLNKFLSITRYLLLLIYLFVSLLLYLNKILKRARM